VVTTRQVVARENCHDSNFSDVIYLDPATHTKIEEVGSANFFGITADNEFITPLSPSILPSITNILLLYLAENRFGMKAIQGDVKIAELDKFVEAGACGTAAVISPIGGVQTVMTSMSSIVRNRSWTCDP
jgi:branched-chain amino acid aminotransferase